MTDGQVREQIPDDLELVDEGAADQGAEIQDLVTEEAQSALDGMVRLVSSAPQLAPLVLDLLRQARDWPYADEIAEHIRAMLPPQTKAEDVQAAAEQPLPMDGIHKTVVEADAAATRAAREAGRKVMSQAYEAHRILAMAAVETMIAHATLALAALKWEPENVPAVAGSLIQANRHLEDASRAVDARLQLASIEGQVMVSQGEFTPTAA